LLVIYSICMLVCGAGYALWDTYQLDGDAISFMDISDAIVHRQWHLVVNGYWNPGYPFALAIGQLVAHPTRWRELQVFYWVNFVIFALCLAATLYFARSLVRLRRDSDPEAEFALNPAALCLTALALMFVSFQRELSLGKVRSDALLFLLMILAAAFLMRIQSDRKISYYALLGTALGLAFLTKSFAMLPSVVLMGGLLIHAIRQRGDRRRSALTGIILCGFIFIAISTPYVYAISKQRGRFTTGESARIAYTVYVDQNDYWWDWAAGHVNHASLHFKHPEQIILSHPQVTFLGQHPYGTNAWWFDPSYWLDKTTPRFYLRGHVIQATRSTELLVRFVLTHPEPFVLLFVLMAGGAMYPRALGKWKCFTPVLGWGLLMILIYYPLTFEERYISFSYLIVIVVLLGVLRIPGGDRLREAAASAATLLLAALILFAAVRDVAEKRRLDKLSYYPFHHLDPDMYSAARGLNGLGISAGDWVACMGELHCHTDAYWARLAGVQLVSDISVPHGPANPGEPFAFWSSLSNQAQIASVLRGKGVAAIVTVPEAGETVPPGWQHIPGSDLCVYLLKQ
jgi:4-amino-4-deoxy-L-arabinose transferase-like glycosyltransferase